MKRKIITGFLPLILVFSLLTGNSSLSRAAALTANSLSDVAKIVRSQGLARNNTITFTFYGSEAEKQKLFARDNTFFYYDLILLDDPEMSDDADYLVGNINFSKGKTSIARLGNNISFYLSYFETKEQTAYVNRQTQAILAELGVASMSNYNKVKTIHDYVCQLITYTDKGEDTSSVYTAYTTGQGLCNSYALCMYKLLTEAGVPCKWIGGQAGIGLDFGGHAWNLVQLGNLWYHLDATWDDDDKHDTFNHDYFLKGSEDFDNSNPKQIHKFDSEYIMTDYLALFPIAKTAFVPGSNDINTVKNPSTPLDSPVLNVTNTTTQPSTYKFGNVITRKQPAGATLTVKRGKWKDILLYIKNETLARKNISAITYKISSGKKYVKTKKYGIRRDRKTYFYDLGVRGKKRGKAKIKITVKMDNGQKKTYSFTVKVK